MAPAIDSAIRPARTAIRGIPTSRRSGCCCGNGRRSTPTGVSLRTFSTARHIACGRRPAAATGCTHEREDHGRHDVASHHAARGGPRRRLRRGIRDSGRPRPHLRSGRVRHVQAVVPGVRHALRLGAARHGGKPLLLRPQPIEGGRGPPRRQRPGDARPRRPGLPGAVLRDADEGRRLADQFAAGRSPGAARRRCWRSRWSPPCSRS